MHFSSCLLQHFTSFTFFSTAINTPAHDTTIGGDLDVLKEMAQNNQDALHIKEENGCFFPCMRESIVGL